MTSVELPAHLQPFVVEQNYERYTAMDQAVWRYIMRQLTSHLAEYAHPIYIEGLKKTGIDVEHIPRIEEMSAKLSEFGWKALPVSGFIPPAAFMEFQSLGYLPIACDMRTVDHILYTPAPDIVHEAAGHAPIIADSDYASYLKAYAKVAQNAIVSSEDLSLYAAIRDLSDIKEHPDSTAEDIQKAEAHLNDVTNSMSFVSEAALLGRMNWWTAEYGLVGDLDNPKIFGAGLLSSVGESRSCLEDRVKKIPLSLDCIDYSYDITEPQPQLFVAQDFSDLNHVLEELSRTMAYRVGGRYGLETAIKAQTVNTVEYNSGLQVSGRLAEILEKESQIYYLKFQGPCQLSMQRQQLGGHGKDFHAQGFGSPLGKLKDGTSLEEFDEERMESYGFKNGEILTLEFESGVVVKGLFVKPVFNAQGCLALMTFDKCSVHCDSTVLFDPAWGIYDMAIGSEVTSVFGGPADRGQYGQTDSFVAKRVPRKEVSETSQNLNRLYQKVREMREAGTATEAELKKLYQELSEHPQEWLLRVEILELAIAKKMSSGWVTELETYLKELAPADNDLLKLKILGGVELAKAQVH